MKILHTGDWHIGKLVHGVHMTEDQRYALDELLKIVKDESVDVVIIAGDLYDRSVPPVEAVMLLDEVLSRLIMDLNVKVIAISGNHDSPDRLDFGGKVLKEKGLHIIGRLNGCVEPIYLEDDYGSVAFYPIPFVEPSVVRAVYQQPEVKTYNDAIEAIIKSLDVDPTIRNICISHAFVMGSTAPETTDSERPLALGGTESVDVAHYRVFDYTALGHLHRPQRAGLDTVRYSGSLLKYSFSELAYENSVTLITVGEKGQCEIETKGIKPLRGMRRITGELEALLREDVSSLGNAQDYIHAVLTDRITLNEPLAKLRAVYPNTLLLTRQAQERSVVTEELTTEALAQQTPIELFEAFYKEVVGVAPEPVSVKHIDEAYQALNQSERGDA